MLSKYFHSPPLAFRYTASHYSRNDQFTALIH